MKRILPLSLAALCAVFLFSSCVYDPLYTGYGSSYYSSNLGYSGGYYNVVYSDFYVGFHNDYYRYRHTRCSHCNHYPCRGGHSASYYTYFRNYRKPLHNDGHGSRHATLAQRGHSSSYSRSHTGNNYGHFGRFSAPVHSSASTHNRGHSASSSRGHTSNSGTLRNSSIYRGSSPRVSTPRPSSPRSFTPPSNSRSGGSRGSGHAHPSGNSRPTRATLTSTASPRTRAPARAPVSKPSPAPASKTTRNVGRNYGGSSSRPSSSSTPTKNVGRKYR